MTPPDVARKVRLRLNQGVLDSRARQLRAQYAVKLADRFLRDFDETSANELIAESPFRDHADNYPHRNASLALAFSIHLTDEIVTALCDQAEDPGELAFTAARVAELGLHSIHDPYVPHDEPHVFLGASKQWGYFFTPPDVAGRIADGALRGRDKVANLLDPGAGTGALLAATLIQAANRGIGVGSVHAIELDPFTLRLSKRILERVRELLDLDFELLPVQGDVVEHLFRQLIRQDGQRYDCIVMNPPYGRVKFLRSFLTNAETRVGTKRRSLDQQDSHWKRLSKERADQFRAISRHLGLGEGAQDYQRLFLGLAIATLEASGRLALISPSSWLGDADSLRLRKRIISDRLLEDVIIFPEGSALFATVNQPTAVAVLSKREGNGHFTMRLANPRTREDDDMYEVQYETLEKLDPERVRIPRISHEMHEIYEIVQAFPRLKDFVHLKNARGELDLTFGKSFITSTPSPTRLVRGDHIERYILRGPEYSVRDGYIDEKAFSRALATMKKGEDIARPRLAGRQVSYLNKGRRLSFALVPPNVVLGNSCNYVCLTQGTEETVATALGALSVMLNSLVLEWYFRIFNSNNHVANYEIDDLPLCMNDPTVVQALAQQGAFLQVAYRSTSEGGKVGSSIEDVADALVAYGFGLTPGQIHMVAKTIEPERADRVASIAAWLYENGIPDTLTSGEGWYNHIPPTLSELDLEIIRHVPQGGNWLDIPESVPSQRLVQIREMTEWRGLVRTTYYGRLRPDQPAYTIATYYNRPGNGTNITPWEDRTLTSREAARLQSFPDWYVFLGTEGSVRKQVGNAVPPLLAYALGKHLKALGADGPCIDLFAGAGGLSLGLELAGWEVVAAVDNDVKAAGTYRFNRPCESEPGFSSGKTLFIEADLTKKTTRQKSIDQIVRKLGDRRLGLLVGGPPCQGFSHAGWRAEGDERNHLASIFMMFVERFVPDIVVLENVEGLLTYGKGQVVTDLMTTLRDLGYTIGAKPWLLRAECYGVPQMRRRVFLVGTRTRGVIDPPVGPMQHCRGRRESDDDPTMFSSLPYPVTAAEAIADLPHLGARTHEGMGSRPVRPYYARWCKGLLTTTELLDALSREG